MSSSDERVACDIEGCRKPAKARGLCQTHYSRWQRHGSPLVVNDRRQWMAEPEAVSLANRLLTNSDRRDGCLLWRGQVNHKGYGQIRLRDRRTATAHRVAYELWVGPIPDGLEIDHLCRQRNCIEPAHLEAVTHAENLRRIHTRRSA